MSNPSFCPTSLPVGAYVEWQGQDAQIYCHYPESQRAAGRDCEIELTETGQLVTVQYADLNPIEARPTPAPDITGEGEGAAVPVRQDGMRVITISNNAGGVGKSTIAVSLAGVYAQCCKRVLVIDLDPQGNATTWSGIDEVRESQTVHPIVVSEEAPLPTPIQANGYEVLPGGRSLRRTEKVAATLEEKFALRNRLQQARGRWDIVLIDTPPSLGQLTTIAAIASDYLIAPISAAFKGVDALGGVTAFVEEIRADHPALDIALFVPTLYAGHHGNDREAYEVLRAHVPPGRLATPIPYRKKYWEEATKAGKPITLYAPATGPAQDARRLAAEVALAVGLSVDIPGVEP